MTFIRGFFPPLIICVLLILKRIFDQRFKLKQTFPFLRNEVLLPITTAVKGKDFFRQLHARQQSSSIAGFFFGSPTHVEFSLATPLLANQLLQSERRKEMDPEVRSAAHKNAISKLSKEIAHWNRDDELPDIAFAVQQAVRASLPSSQNPAAAVEVAHSLATWMLVHLPTFQKELQEEVTARVGTRLPPGVDDLDALDMLNRFCLETVRMHTPLSIQSVTLSQRAMECGHFVFPLHARVHVPVFLSNESEEFFVNANVFDPNRFVLRPLERENVCRSQTEEEEVGFIVSRALLALVLQRFWVTTTQQPEGDLVESQEVGAVSFPRKPFPMRFQLREGGRTL